jgi:hypothetical protein
LFVANTFEDIVRFLKYNGQDFDNIPGIEVQYGNPANRVGPEAFHQGPERENFAAEVATNQEPAWADIKNTSIKFNGSVVHNPLESRFHHGAKCMKALGEAFDNKGTWSGVDIYMQLAM